jgi:hypothetical protein
MRARPSLLALMAALAIMMTVPVGATSGITLNSFSSTDHDHGEPTTVTFEMTTTSNYDWLVIDTDGAIDFIEDSDPAAPDNGDVIGRASFSIKYPALFCLRNTYAYDIAWVSPIGGTAPAGTTAQFLIDTVTGDVPGYVIPDSNGHDVIHVDMSSHPACSSDPRVDLEITFYGNAFNRNTNPVVTTNGAAGTYTLTVSADSHSDTVSYTVQ